MWVCTVHGMLLYKAKEGNGEFFLSQLHFNVYKTVDIDTIANWVLGFFLSKNFMVINIEWAMLYMAEITILYTDIFLRINFPSSLAFWIDSVFTVYQIFKYKISIESKKNTSVAKH